MPTRQREYLTRRSFRAPHVEHDASWGGTSAPQEAQRRGFTLARAPHLLQYALSDGTSAPQDGQRIYSFAFSAGCSVDIARVSYHTRRASWNGTDRKRGFRFLLRHDGWGTAIPSGALNRATGDSRLRGNDVGGSGNDVGGCGNDVGGCGNDVGGCGNDGSVWE